MTKLRAIQKADKDYLPVEELESQAAESAKSPAKPKQRASREPLSRVPEKPGMEQERLNRAERLKSGPSVRDLSDYNKRKRNYTGTPSGIAEYSGKMPKEQFDKKIAPVPGYTVEEAQALADSMLDGTFDGKYDPKKLRNIGAMMTYVPEFKEWKDRPKDIIQRNNKLYELMRENGMITDTNSGLNLDEFLAPLPTGDMPQVTPEEIRAMSEEDFSELDPRLFKDPVYGKNGVNNPDAYQEAYEQMMARRAAATSRFGHVFDNYVKGGVLRSKPRERYTFPERMIHKPMPIPQPKPIIPKTEKEQQAYEAKLAEENEEAERRKAHHAASLAYGDKIIAENKDKANKTLQDHLDKLISLLNQEQAQKEGQMQPPAEAKPSMRSNVNLPETASESELLDALEKEARMNGDSNIDSFDLLRRNHFDDLLGEDYVPYAADLIKLMDQLATAKGQLRDEQAEKDRKAQEQEDIKARAEKIAEEEKKAAGEQGPEEVSNIERLEQKYFPEEKASDTEAEEPAPKREKAKGKGKKNGKKDVKKSDDLRIPTWAEIKKGHLLQTPIDAHDSLSPDLWEDASNIKNKLNALVAHRDKFKANNIDGKENSPSDLEKVKASLERLNRKVAGRVDDHQTAMNAIRDVSEDADIFDAQKKMMQDSAETL